jgi:hypothetical protein
MNDHQKKWEDPTRKYSPVLKERGRSTYSNKKYSSNAKSNKDSRSNSKLADSRSYSKHCETFDEGDKNRTKGKVHSR